MTNSVLTISDLNGIVEPTPVNLFPLAPVLSVLLILLAFALMLGLVRGALNWHRNAYRREGLRQLQQAAEPAEILILLKRVALVQWPRESVAPLHGDEWIAFLNEHCSHCSFEPNTELDQLRHQAGIWIRFHRGATAC